MKDARNLLERYKRGECTEEEHALLLSWFDQLEEKSALSLTEADFTEAKSNFERNISQTKIRRFRWRAYAAVAAMLLFFGSAVYLVSYKGYLAEILDISDEKELALVDDVTLTLADGSIIHLNELKEGQLVVPQEGIEVSKQKDGSLKYSFFNMVERTSSKDAYHTLRTPIGEQYQIELPDGTKVWMNASSELKFPAVFVPNKDRVIELSGEAYLEVATVWAAHRKKQPFLVKTKNQTIEVLGTAFNVSAYEDDPGTVTSLRHGQVRVSSNWNKNDKGLVLKPGEQSLLTENKLSSREMNWSEVTAWRDGQLKFTDQNIYAIMRVLSRWHRLDVQFKGDFEGNLFGGTISKEQKLEDVLDMLEITGQLKFQLQKEFKKGEERRVVVMK